MGESSTTTIATRWVEYRESRHFQGLDGWRALSILLVLTSHMQDGIWDFFNGALGVTLFFVISGFLITTLLLRERDKSGRISLKNFYVRRVFRIVPMYFLALAITSFAVLALRLGSGSAGFLERLPLLATFNGELAGEGTFSHSWSLGIEEKFYLIWPILAFCIPFLRNRLGLLLAFLAPLAFLASFIAPFGYIGIYMPILGGCALAVALHCQRSFKLVSVLAQPIFAVPLFMLMAVWALFGESWQFIDEQSRYAHSVFGLLAVLALPGVIIGTSLVRRIFGSRPLAYYGRHAYGIYLFHPFCVDTIDRYLPPGQDSILSAIIRFVFVVVASFAVAWVLRIVIEQPFIALGRKLTSPVPRSGELESGPSAFRFR